MEKNVNEMFKVFKETEKIKKIINNEICLIIFLINKKGTIV